MSARQTKEDKRAEKIEIVCASPRHANAWVHMLSVRGIEPLFYLVFAPIAILVLCFTTPPFQVADEPSHFLRAVQISSGGWMPQFCSTSDLPGGTVPLAANSFIVDQMSPQTRARHSLMTNASERWVAMHRISYQSPSTTGFVGFNAVVYHPLGYAPQALGVLVGRLLSDHVSTWFYAGRIANGLFCLILVYIALRLTPSGRPIFLLTAVLPMTLNQFASFSPDAATTSIAMIVVALCLHYAVREVRSIPFWLVAAIVCLTLAKAVFLPFAILPLMAAPRVGKWRALQVAIVAAVCAWGIYSVWSWQTSRALQSVALRQGGNPAAQISCMANHPLLFPEIAVDTWRQVARPLFNGFVGILSWLTVTLPSWFYNLAAAIIVLTLGTTIDRRQLFNVRAIYVIVIVGLCCAAITLGAYIIWNPPCANVVAGLQGRYFLPLLPLAAILGTANASPMWRRVLPLILVIPFSFMSAAVTFESLHAFYYYEPISKICFDLPLGRIDAPTENSLVGSTVSVGGWALGKDAIRRIDVFLDRKLVGSSALDVPRPDVDKAIPNTIKQAKGWNTVLDLRGISPGDHELIAEAQTFGGCRADIGAVRVRRSE